MPRLMQKLIKILMPYVYSRPYVYSFCQIFQALRLFPALHTSILDSRVTAQSYRPFLDVDELILFKL